MQRIVHITVLLVNILWVAFFLTPDPLAVFVQRRSTSSSDEETLVREFCIQPPSDVMWTPTLGPVSVHADMTSTTLDVHAAPKTTAAEPPSPSSTVGDLREGPPAAPPVKTLSSSELIPSSTSKAAPVKPIDCPVRPRDEWAQRSHHSRVPDDCCFTYYPRPLNKNLIRSYYMTDDRCPKPGAVFITKKCRHICVDPSLPWAVDIIKNLNKKSF